MKTKRESVLEVVTALTGVTAEDILGNRRQAHIVEARHAVAYCLSKIAGFSYKQAGRLIGRDHSTIINGVDRFQWRLDREDATAVAIVEAAKEASIARDAGAGDAVRTQDELLTERIRKVEAELLSLYRRREAIRAYALAHTPDQRAA